MKPALSTIVIQTEEDVVVARRQAREIAALFDFDPADQTRIATAVSEIARNAFVYAGGGQVEFFGPDGAAAFTIVIADHGPGIPNLKQVLDGTHLSGPGMGLGIMGARRLMDDVRIESTVGEGTVVTLSKRLPGPLPPQRLAEVAADLKRSEPGDLLNDLRRENQELLRLTEELRARQEDLTRLNAELEDTNRGVVALYGELDEKAERLRRSDQMKSRFLSHMSHEFRTPLTSIMALSRLLIDEADGKLTPEQQKQVSFVRKSAENLLEMVNDLLDLARVEAGKVLVRPTRFTVSSLFSALRGVLKPLLGNDAVELVFEDPTAMLPLFTDEGKLAQILRNLISNALKFTERGEVRVSARLDSRGGNAVFAVSDTGIGIAPNHVDIIFQEFAQIETPVQKRFKGTGLGLPLSKGLAELLGGSISVESEPGKGSTFTVRIPAQYAGVTGPPEFDATSPDLLLIDDEEVSRYLIRQCLGCPPGIIEAPDGASGIALARERSPAAILLDLRMPGMSGFEVLAALKADPKTCNIPVVIMTAKAMTADELALLQSSAAAVLSKEVLSLSDAAARIRSTLANVSRANTAASPR